MPEIYHVEGSTCVRRSIWKGLIYFSDPYNIVKFYWSGNLRNCQSTMAQMQAIQEFRYA